MKYISRKPNTEQINKANITYRRFELLLLEKNMSISDVERLTNMDGQKIKSWRLRHYIPKLTEFRQLADVMGINVQYLTNGILPFIKE